MCCDTKNWVSTPLTCEKSDRDAHSPAGFLSPWAFNRYVLTSSPPPIHTSCVWEKPLCFRRKKKRRRKQVCETPNSLTGGKKKNHSPKHIFICITGPQIWLNKLKIISVYVSVKCVIRSVFQWSSTCFRNQWETKRREPESQEVWLRHLLLTLMRKPCQCTSRKGELISYPLSSKEIPSESRPGSEPLGCHYTSEETCSLGPRLTPEVLTSEWKDMMIANWLHLHALS